MGTNDFNQKIAGRFRGNTAASDHNSFRAVDQENPGTPATDSLVVNTTGFTGGESVSGINLTGKDGVAKDFKFRKQQRPDGQNIEQPLELPALTASYDISDLRWLVHDAVQREETDPIVKVEYDNAGNTITITHIGSGTLNGLIVDGTAVGSATRTSF